MRRMRGRRPRRSRKLPCSYCFRHGRSVNPRTQLDFASLHPPGPSADVSAGLCWQYGGRKLKRNYLRRQCKVTRCEVELHLHKAPSPCYSSFHQFRQLKHLHLRSSSELTGFIMRVQSTLMVLALCGATMAAAEYIKESPDQAGPKETKPRKQDLLAARVLDAIKDLAARFRASEGHVQQTIQIRDFQDIIDSAPLAISHSKQKATSITATPTTAILSTSSAALLHTEQPLGDISTTSAALPNTELPLDDILHKLNARDEPPFQAIWHTPTGWTAEYEHLATGTAVATDSAGHPVDPSAPTESAEGGAAAPGFSCALLLGLVTAVGAALM